MGLPSKYGIDWGPCRNVIAFFLATFLVLGLILLFGASDNASSNGDASWE